MIKCSTTHLKQYVVCERDNVIRIYATAEENRGQLEVHVQLIILDCTQLIPSPLHEEAAKNCCFSSCPLNCTKGSPIVLQMRCMISCNLQTTVTRKRTSNQPTSEILIFFKKILLQVAMNCLCCILLYCSLKRHSFGQSSLVLCLGTTHFVIIFCYWITQAIQLSVLPNVSFHVPILSRDFK